MKIVQRLKADKALRFRIEKWCWVAMIAPTVLWWRDSVTYVALLSVYALVISSSGREHSARAADAAEANAGGNHNGRTGKR